MAKRSKSRRFAAIPHSVLVSADYRALSNIAKSLLIELVFQYNGKNNGDLTLAWTVLKQRGFNSESTINRGKVSLIERRIVTEVRKGIAKKGVRLCSLYALNWLSLDEVFYDDGTPKHQLKGTNAPLRSYWDKHNISGD
ncbi:hypothetical protein [Thalassotalea montiporae]